MWSFLSFKNKNFRFPVRVHVITKKKITGTWRHLLVQFSNFEFNNLILYLTGKLAILPIISDKLKKNNFERQQGYYCRRENKKAVKRNQNLLLKLEKKVLFRLAAKHFLVENVNSFYFYLSIALQISVTQVWNYIINRAYNESKIMNKDYIY